MFTPEAVSPFINGTLHYVSQSSERCAMVSAQSMNFLLTRVMQSCCIASRSLAKLCSNQTSMARIFDSCTIQVQRHKGEGFETQNQIIVTLRGMASSFRNCSPQISILNRQSRVLENSTYLGVYSQTQVPHSTRMFLRSFPGVLQRRKFKISLLEHFQRSRALSKSFFELRLCREYSSLRIFQIIS